MVKDRTTVFSESLKRRPGRDSSVMLKLVPRRPGVYLLKDKKGRILYIGKARKLASRVRNHFKPIVADPRHDAMMSKVWDVDYIATQSEIEALILEANLIKLHRPKYNINLKDDKRYPFLKVTVQEQFPRMILTRRLEEDGSRYFGPFTDVKAVRKGVRLLRGAFKLRSCPGDEPGRLKNRECLDYQIGICAAPCTSKIDKEEYKSLVDELLGCLAGRSEGVVDGLKGEMETASRQREYEKCARLRDRVTAIESALRRQRVFVLRDYDSDVFGLARHCDRAAAVVLKVREGKVLGKDTLILEGAAGRSDEEVVSFAMAQYYLNAAVIPGQILLSVPFKSDQSVLRRWLSDKAAREVELTAPKRGEGWALQRMARDNALLALEESRALSGEKLERTAPEVSELQRATDLPVLPVRIEAFDISQIGGQQAVASVVVYHNGRPRRSENRRMKIRGVVGQDDFSMMEEAVRRRLERLLNEKKVLPDLLLVDGGKGQISAAAKALRHVGMETLGVMGIAKEKEELNFSWREGSLQLPLTSRSLRFLQRIRDDAHRSALMYHRKLRKRATLRSEIDMIDGIGSEKRRALLRRFGSVHALRIASIDDICSVQGIGRVLAHRVLEKLHGTDTGGSRLGAGNKRS